jgi:hypothetical protein
MQGETMLTELIGHTSPETAYEVPDYPYGFRLRTTIRYWIETKKGQGQRVMSQTRNPKKTGQPWNKPNASTYNAIKVLVLNSDNGHVESRGIGGYDSEETIEQFRAAYPQSCADERNRKTIETLIAMHRASKRITWEVKANPGPDEPRQTREEQNEIMSKLTTIELAKLRKGGQS